MDALPPMMAMQMAVTQQNAALSMMKQTAQMQQQIADMLLASASGRGGSVDFAA